MKERISNIPTPLRPQAAHEELDAQTLSNLELMSKDALIALIKRIGGACWGIGLQTKKETAEAMKTRLAIDALTTEDAKQALANIKEWLDREEGRAKQQIELTGKDGEPLSMRLIAAQQRLLKDVTPQHGLIENM